MSPLANATLISPRLQSDTHAPTVQLRKEASFASPSSFNKNMVSSSPYINRTPGTVRKRLREDNSPNDRDGREYTKTRRIESPARPLYNTYKRGSIGGESEYGREERETIDYWLNLGLGMSMAREMNDPAVNVNAFQHRRSIDGRVSAPVAVTVAAATPRIDRIQMVYRPSKTQLIIYFTSS